MRSVARGLWKWWAAPLPRGRVAALRTILYTFVVLDVLVVTPWVAVHGSLPRGLYSPLLVARVLPLPVPTEALVTVVRFTLLGAAAVAATGRFHRSAGTAVFVLYLEWMLIAFSYGKVDHDRFPLLVALAVLPTAGRCRWGDRTESEAAGWAVHWMQVAVVCTYFLSVFAKWRFGGFGWVNSAALMRVALRRGTFLADPLTDHPLLLRAGQYLILSFELVSPLLLARGRPRTILLLAAAAFHVVTFATIRIMFWPHVVCLLAFLPLERVHPAAWMRRATAVGGRRPVLIPRRRGTLP